MKRAAQKPASRTGSRSNAGKRNQQPMLKPPALRDGDTVGIVAPASAIDSDALKHGCARLLTLGYKPLFFDSIFDCDIYFAGSVRQRVNDLHEMFRREDVRAIICARGGYGCNYLLPHLDLELLRANWKPFVGYSDVTTLLNWFVDNGLMAFHGPMVTKDFAHEDGVDLVAWRAVMDAEPCVAEFITPNDVQPMVMGSASGILYGGCLSMLVASLGTPYEIQTGGKILFMEDVSAKPYQIDRMLMQLKLAGKFDAVKGIVFGEMLDCVQPGGQPYSLQQIVQRVVGDLGIPVAYGISSGHVEHDNMVLPFGVTATLEVTDNSVRLAFDSSTIAHDATSQTVHS